MSGPQFIFDNFNLFLGLVLAWTALWLAFFAWRRMQRGAWHPPVLPSQVLFSEKFVSGASQKNLLTKFGGARNALSVTVTSDALLIKYLPPFNWIMPFGFNDLEHYVSRRNIRMVKPITSWGRDGVVIEFVAENAGPKRIELLLRHRNQFMAAIS